MLTVNSSIRITDSGVTKTLAVFSGTSQDTKPVFKIYNGSEFHEIDTGSLYRFNMATEQWVYQPQGETVIAPEYDPSLVYNKFSLCTHDGILYIAQENGITGPWDETKWQASTISEILENLQKPFIFVEELPETGIEGKLYFVPASEPQTGDVFEEYIWKGDGWERIGGVSIDLSNYYTKTQADSLFGRNLTFTCEMADGTTKTLAISGALS